LNDSFSNCIEAPKPTPIFDDELYGAVEEKVSEDQILKKYGIVKVTGT